MVQKSLDPQQSHPTEFPRYQVASGRVQVDQPPASRNLADQFPPNQSTAFHRVEKGTDASRWVITIAVVLILGAVYIASSLLVPLTISTLAYLTLRPTVMRLCKLGLGQTPATAVAIVGCFSIVAIITLLLYEPLQGWLTNAPESMQKIREKFADVAEPLTTVDRAEDKLSEATAGVSEEPRKLQLEVAKPGLFDKSYLINQTGHVLVFIAAIAVLTFFMLSSGDDLLNRILNVLPDESRRVEVLETIGSIQDNVGKYLLQISIINFGLAVAVSIVMWLVGMPTPILWGVMAGLLNFIPFIGPIGGTVIVFIAAGTAFDSFPRSAATAAAFWLTTAVEGQFVTPTIVGKSLKVGSLIVLVAVSVWGFLWGLPGVFLAVPLVIAMREIFSSFESTHPLAVILGETPRRPVDERRPVKEDQPIAEAISP